MATFIVSFLLLILGYFLYGQLVERLFGANPANPMPCDTKADGVDYIAMPAWRVFLIQFLNIAGTGPIFGAIQGILFGPAAYFWIVLGCIFGGAVHDYLCGMISIRKGGVSVTEIIGDELGKKMRVFMLVFSLVLLVLVGTVFVVTPAGLLATLVGGESILGRSIFWVVVIFAYYILATLLPIDKLIGKIYPVFGFALLAMAAGLLVGIFTKEGNLPEITGAFTNHHPSTKIPLFPGLFITIACGAVSGFHATQSPLMARCLTNERLGRPIFYGAMVTEGFVALIWAAASIKFADSLNVAGATPYEKLLTAMTTPEGSLNPALIVNHICQSWMGKAGAILAILGVVAAPITSGDTAFRSARIIAGDFCKLRQDNLVKRLILSVPMFVLSAILMNMNFDVLWRYFGWVNQTLAAIMLWAGTVWLHRQGRCFVIGLVPACWMTLVSVAYIFVAPEGFNLLPIVGDVAALVATLLALAFFYIWHRKEQKTNETH